MDVRMPDGTIIRGVPEGTTKDQIRAKWEAMQAPPEPEREPDSFGERFIRGASQPVVGAAQLMSRPLSMLGEGVNRVLPGAGDYLVRTREEADALAQQLRDDAKAGAPEGIDAATLAGQTATTLPLGALKLGGAGVQALGRAAPRAAQFLENAVRGGTTGLALSNTNEGSVGQNVGVGTAAGVVVPPALKALATAASPMTRTISGRLAREGIELTPGMAGGQTAKRIEDAATSVPVLGDAIRSGQKKAFESFNRAVLNRALAPTGKPLPKGMAGREAIEHTSKQLGQAYDDLLPKLKVVADREFIGDVTKMQSMVQSLPKDIQEQFSNILRRDVLGRFTSAGRMSGQTMKEVESELGFLSSKFRQAQGDPYKNKLGDAIGELQTSLRTLVERSNPGKQKELQAINQGYAVFKRAQRAASSVTSEDGVFTPEQLHSAVKALDRSKDHARFAEGNALLQDLSETARSTMGRRVPDSGTPLRALVGAGALGGGVVMNPLAALMAGSAALPYIAPGRQAVNALMFKRPPGSNALAELLSNPRTAAAAVPASAAVSVPLLQGGPNP